MVAERTTHEERDSRLDEVIASYLEVVESGQTPDRGQWLARYPDLADDLAAFFADEDGFDGLVAPLREGTPTPQWGGTTGNGSTPRPPSPHVEPPTSGRRFGDYELLDEVARGGMGVVFKARQVSLNRLVAVKMIREAEWATPAEVQRFRLEAEAVANLDHENIVPIYEVGANSGQQYFSMSWVEGGNLAQAIARGEWPARGAAGQRAAARLLATVARAVHYAHERGILHRDLKPANILLSRRTSSLACPPPKGKQGCLPYDPMIADFGLAKRVAANDHLTQSGTAVGTPSYMAPEQAAPGRKGAGLTLAADVYSLGAILYELLTGLPPFRGATPLETLRDVLEREPARPRTRNRAVDRDLETVCLKCLEKDPAKRYPTAAVLADDLERFIGGEPVQARPVGSVERLRRWCGRNRVLASVSALAVLALVAATAVSLLLAVREARHADQRDRVAKELQRQKEEAEKNAQDAEEHRREADRQRQREEESFRQAHKAVNDFCLRVSEELRRIPGTQPLRKRLFEESLGYYGRFLLQRAQDPKLKRELAEAQFNVAMMNSEIGRKTDAAAAYHAALAIFRELQQADPADVDLRFREANALINLGVIYQSLGRPKEALAAYEKARGVYQHLPPEQAKHVFARAGLADVHSGIGAVQRRGGKYLEAVEAYTRAVALHEQLQRENPNDGHREDLLALACNNLGVAQTHAGQGDAAMASFHKAYAIRERRARQEPRRPDLQIALAGSLRDLALAHRDRGETFDALRLMHQVLDIRARVAQDNPSVIPYQSELAVSHTDVGQFHHAKGDLLRGKDERKAAHDELQTALNHYNAARRILENLVRVDGSAPNLRSALALVHFHAGTLSMGAKDHNQAIRAFSLARKIQEKLAKDHPDLLEYQALLAKTLNNLAVVLKHERRLEEARAALHDGIERQRALVEQAPHVTVYRQTLTTLYVNVLDVEKTANRPTAAAAAVVGRRKLWPKDANEQFRAARDLAAVAEFVGKGKSARSVEEEAERGRCADLVMDALRDAATAGFRDRQRLEGDPLLALVRGRADFQKLLAELPR